MLNMMLPNTYIEPVKIYIDKPFIVEWDALCQKVNPPPVFCELPDELKLRSISSSGTVETYTFTSSMVSLASVGTSTTTTF